MITELPAPDITGGAAVPALAADVHHVGPVCVLRLAGSLDAGTLRVLQQQFDRLGRSPCHHVVLDLAAVVAIDPAGARLLTGLHHYVGGRGGMLSVVGATPTVLATLAGTALAAA